MTGPLPPAVAEVAGLVRAFAATLERADALPRAALLDALVGQLGRLLAAGSALPDPAPVDDPPEHAAPAPRGPLERALAEADVYRSVFDPFDAEGGDDPPSRRSLVDDLGALYEEWVRPLRSLEDGHVEDAAFEWRFSLRGHGGRLATAVLHALQALRSLHEDEDEDGAGPEAAAS